jgi:dinuclear metal center YbgI/SA1388 family protein
MVQPPELAAYCDALLDAASFSDYCPNGLQVQGTRSIRRLAAGVTASLAMIEAAADWGADAILVHHGWFWKGEPAPLTGMKGERVRALYARGMSLLAYHLPLDCHPEIGNNATLGSRLGFRNPAPTPAADGMLWQAELEAPLAPADLAWRIEAALGRPPLHIAGGPAGILRVGWCSGAAQDFIAEAADLGLDAYVSGEISEPTTHTARERGIHYFAAGHHATERYGVRALGERLAGHFGLEVEYLEIDNPA